MQRIATLTMNPAIDTSASVDHVIPERKLRCTLPLHEPGGGGINVSRAIRKLGGASITLYPVGGPTHRATLATPFRAGKPDVAPDTNRGLDARELRR